MSTNLKCPRCGCDMHKAIAYSGSLSEFWYVCGRAPACNTYYNSFKPQPHQHSVLMDNHELVGNCGGYGSAKTSATRQSIYKQAFLSPGATILVGANVSSQYEQTIKKELESDIPAAFVRDFNKQKQYMELFNGARILYRPLDDVDKLRSMNLSAWYIIEGSEVDPEAFTQLKTRLRNMAAAVMDGFKEQNGIRVPNYKYFRGIGMVESNPDSGWIRNDMLLQADSIKYHGAALQKYKPGEGADKKISVHISATDCNAYLPDGYIERISANKPAWWVERYVYGSFEFANGLCCPKYKDNIVPSFEIPDHWLRLISYDPGIVDPSAFVNVAIDQEKGIAYAYRDLQFTDLSVEQLAVMYWTRVAYDISHGQLYTPPIMDPKMYGRRMMTDLETLDHMWAQYGVYFQPGHVNVKDRIWRLNTYFEAGRLKIMDNCVNLIREFGDYKFKPQKLNAPVKEEPVDKNNHSIDALQWICMKLPEKPSNLVYGAYNGRGESLDSENKVSTQYCPQLSDDDTDDEYSWSMEV